MSCWVAVAAVRGNESRPSPGELEQTLHVLLSEDVFLAPEGFGGLSGDLYHLLELLLHLGRYVHHGLSNIDVDVLVRIGAVFQFGAESVVVKIRAKQAQRLATA